MDKLTALSAFAALSQGNRLDAFRLLIKAGDQGLAAGEIAEALEVKQNTMSASLSVLHQAGLVRNERQGRSIRYFVDMVGLRGLLAFLMEDCCGGNPDLCRPILDDIACC
ncbi:ArsR/SmtB family transcription factor [Thalassovita mediterranea]|jgi:DNA-binding transcriptional ArsR family regulator|uniref:Helix-turn-helix domain protein n=1 Tax=Thalassovita mediterranea TaxID=340021 RepID=A0A0P1H3X3_9RHOB|nr:metalloregulator ArsR/SmtB family transcription factor [Thalassovita mediterranea]MCG7572809.1 metalloregulator ArsR/SmtB family transcription factor [Phaeobacter sp. CNT1-3]CUH85326.1 Helix-turn-helix domain protein [Thalassovita mediterranea]SIS30439.1 transcriptional regulator, ArsR family [Thalassovita mediterranea]